MYICYQPLQYQSDRITNWCLSHCSINVSRYFCITVTSHCSITGTSCCSINVTRYFCITVTSHCSITGTSCCSINVSRYFCITVTSHCSITGTSCCSINVTNHSSVTTSYCGITEYQFLQYNLKLVAAV